MQYVVIYAYHICCTLNSVASFCNQGVLCPTSFRTFEQVLLEVGSSLGSLTSKGDLKTPRFILIHKNQIKR